MLCHFLGDSILKNKGSSTRRNGNKPGWGFCAGFEEGLSYAFGNGWGFFVVPEIVYIHMVPN